MLIALLTAYLVSLFGGASGDGLIPYTEIRGRVVEVIPERDRCRAVLDVVERARDVDREFQAALMRTAESLGALNRSRQSDAASMEQVFIELDAARGSAQSELLDLRFTMRDLMTREEWAAVFEDR